MLEGLPGLTEENAGKFFGMWESDIAHTGRYKVRRTDFYDKPEDVFGKDRCWYQKQWKHIYQMPPMPKKKTEISVSFGDDERFFNTREEAECFILKLNCLLGEAYLQNSDIEEREFYLY